MNRSVQSLTTALKNVNTAINYLSVMSKYDTNMALSDFMKSTVDVSVDYIKADVKLKHTVHLWILLKYCQTDALMRSQQVSVICTHILDM